MSTAESYLTIEQHQFLNINNPFTSDHMSKEKIIEYLKELGLPSGDNYNLPSSKKRFSDGAYFRTEELPTTVEAYEKLFSLCDKYDFTVNKITDTRGIMFDTDDELLKKLELARENGTEVMMGPGAGERPFDISQQAALQAMVHGKIRGMDQLVNTIHSMFRAIELGCRGFLMYDEGLLYIASKMRKDGIIPSNTKFKISANVSVANASSMRFWFNLLEPGDSINPVRDLTYPMISAIRDITDNPMDLHIYWRTCLARIMDAPELVRIGAPCYLKNARSGPGVSSEERFLLGVRAVENIEKYYPEAKQSKPGAKGLAIPVKPSTKW